MHSTGVAIASLFVSATSVVGIELPPSIYLTGLVIGVALIGVPHGGLDHWTGKQLLASRFPRTWPALFFPAYLATASVVVVGWNWFPVVTAVSFFLVSAWHFGFEDEPRDGASLLKRSLVAASLGGLVIWVTVLSQSSQVEALLRSVLPRQSAHSAATIVTLTGWVAMVMIPIAAVVIARDVTCAAHRRSAIRNACLSTMFATAHVLLSFGIYFCGWHSIRGLKRLAAENNLTIVEVLLSALPLSIVAILLALFGLWLSSSGEVLSDAMTRTLFVALSAMAVPHLLLHGPLPELVQRVLRLTELPDAAEVTG